MNKLISHFALAALLLSLMGGAGCKKKVPAVDPAAPTASALPGSSDVMAALGKKDYDAALAALVKIRQGITTAEQDTQFTVLAHEVKNKLLDASASDPKAGEALGRLRAMTASR
jgi:hypothetical protein